MVWLAEKSWLGDEHEIATYCHGDIIMKEREADLLLRIYSEENKMIGNQFYWGILTVTFIIVSLSLNKDNYKIVFAFLGFFTCLILYISLNRCASARNEALDIAKEDNTVGDLIKRVYEDRPDRRCEFFPSVVTLMRWWLVFVILVFLIIILSII